MNETARKGTSGRIGIVGGSKDYTGAPYYASMASLRVSGDLAYVICCESASSTIKSYSPELIVLPILDDDSFKNEFSLLVPKLHSIIIGPGLGRKRKQFQAATEVINLAKQHDLPITIDADAILLVADSPQLIKGYQKTILTPNAREFDYLCDKIGIGGCNLKVIDQDEIRSKINKLSNVLDGVTIVRKDKIDFISNGCLQADCTIEGSFRRCGGQGDVLAGAIGTFNYWSNLNSTKLPDSFKSYATVLAAYTGCCI